MRGNNPIRKPLNNNGDILEVKEIFATIQGEGPYSGRSAIFIRLGGCNLACDFCDTDFENFTSMKLKEITSKAISLKQGNSFDLIVITGGEPLRQNISKLTAELIRLGFLVQIETNGTLYRELPKEVKIICSPKNNGDGYHLIRDDILRRANAIKFLISKNDKRYSKIQEVGQNQYDIPVYIQPMDEFDEEKNRDNVDLAISLSQQKGYILSLQIHKYLGIK